MERIDILQADRLLASIEQQIKGAGLQTNGPGFCDRDASDVIRAFEGEAHLFEEPLFYEGPEGRRLAVEHHVAILLGGQVVDLGNPTQQVYESMQAYLLESGIVFIG